MSDVQLPLDVRWDGTATRHELLRRLDESYCALISLKVLESRSVLPQHPTSLVWHQNANVERVELFEASENTKQLGPLLHVQ